MRLGGDCKNNDLHPLRFDRGGNEPYYTRPMAGGSPDLVDCVQLAEAAALLERDYELRDLPRLGDALADTRGILHARFEFSKLRSGRAGARVEIRAAPRLRCQRCLQGFALPISIGSQVEFAAQADAAPTDEERELVQAEAGRISLRALAEEELLLALPIAPACAAPQSCGNAPGGAAAADEDADLVVMRRPFGALEDLLKKRDRT